MLSTNAGNTAKNYLNTRVFSKSTIKQFELGYSPNSWDSLKNEAHKNGLTDISLVDAGLILERDGGGSYDRFRDRLMFPIHDAMGKVVGFGARQMTDDKSQPKYMNSPQTIVYDKSRLLYGLFFAKNEIRAKEYVILVEGYADVITLHQAGIKNVVASSGTSLTKEQLSLMLKYCKKIYIVYDADSAGVSATVRGLELALEQGFEVFIVLLPQGEDPDSLVRNHGAKLFNSYISEAITFVDFKVQQFKKDGILSTPAGRANAIREVINLITKIPDRLQHDEYISRLSSLLNLSPTQLERIYEEKKKIEETHSKSQRDEHRQEPPERMSHGHENNVQDASSDNPENEITEIKYDDLLPEEVFLFQILLVYSELLKLLKSSNHFVPDTMFSKSGKRLLKILFDFEQKSDDIITDIITEETINNSDKHYFTDLVFNKSEISKNWSKYIKGYKDFDKFKPLNDYILQIELKKLAFQISEIMNKIRSSDDVNNIDNLVNYNKIKIRYTELLGKLEFQ